MNDKVNLDKHGFMRNVYTNFWGPYGNYSPVFVHLIRLVREKNKIHYE